MEIKIKRINDDYKMEAVNELGKSVIMDASSAIGGGDDGARPMELLLMALGGCSGIDIINILKKQKADLQSLQITINGEREPGAVPSLFRKIDVRFSLAGNLDADKVERAVELSMEKYCSVAKTLEKTAAISYQFEIQGAGNRE